MLINVNGCTKKRGSGFLNKLIDKLPIELHIPGYNFCGPGTKLKSRLARGDRGINKLDEACKQHDIAYHKFKDTANRRLADKLLARESFKRVTSRDSSFKEKVAALGVATAMKVKSTFGMGLKKRKRSKCKKGNGIGFKKAVSLARKSLNINKPKTVKTAAQLALKTLRPYKKHIRRPTRIIPIPKKIGGFIGLASLLAALSAAGALAGGASAVAKAVYDVKSAKAQLEEQKRHNRVIEAAHLGNGLVIKPYKTGFGFYLRPYDSKN